jgi:hypothetical protein
MYTFTSFDGPGKGSSAGAGTNMKGIANTGAAVGFGINNNGNITNFVRNPDGTFTTQNINGSRTAMAFGINSTGDVVEAAVATEPPSSCLPAVRSKRSLLRNGFHCVRHQRQRQRRGAVFHERNHAGVFTSRSASHRKGTPKRPQLARNAAAVPGGKTQKNWSLEGGVEDFVGLRAKHPTIARGPGMTAPSTGSDESERLSSRSTQAICEILRRSKARERGSRVFTASSESSRHSAASARFALCRARGKRRLVNHAFRRRGNAPRSRGAVRTFFKLPYVAVRPNIRRGELSHPGEAPTSRPAQAARANPSSQVLS